MVNLTAGSADRRRRVGHGEATSSCVSFMFGSRGAGGVGVRGYLQLVLKNTGQHKERERTQEIISYKTLTTEFVVFTQH